MGYDSQEIVMASLLSGFKINRIYLKNLLLIQLDEVTFSGLPKKRKGKNCWKIKNDKSPLLQRRLLIFFFFFLFDQKYSVELSL